MAIDLLKEKGVPLDKQRFTWRELAPKPISKLNDDAFTRVRIILMNGIECEANRFSHACASIEICHASLTRTHPTLRRNPKWKSSEPCNNGL